MFLIIPMFLAMVAFLIVSLFSGLYLFVPWWKLPNRWTNTPLWTRLWVWGWSLVAQGYVLFCLADFQGISDPSAAPVAIGLLSILAALMLWFCAGVIYRNEATKRTRVARRV